jgi:hypothetical protein
MPTADLDIWRRIQHTAQELETSIEEYLPDKGHDYVHTSSINDPMDYPTLSSPTSILADLLNTGIVRSVAQELSNSYMSAALKLRSTTQESFRVTCAKLTDTRADGLDSLKSLSAKVFDAFKATYERTLTQWVDLYVAGARERVAKSTNAASIESRSKSKPRHIFNHVCDIYLLCVLLVYLLMFLPSCSTMSPFWNTTLRKILYLPTPTRTS